MEPLKQFPVLLGCLAIRLAAHLCQSTYVFPETCVCSCPREILSRLHPCSTTDPRDKKHNCSYLYGMARGSGMKG